MLAVGAPADEDRDLPGLVLGPEHVDVHLDAVAERDGHVALDQHAAVFDDLVLVTGVAEVLGRRALAPQQFELRIAH